MATSSPPARAEFPSAANDRLPAASSAAAAECSSSDPSTAPCARPSLPRQASSIARQASIYSLTWDEFQNTLGEPGKPFGSMNMDEFLKNIWTAEESQAMAVAIGSGGDDVPAHAWQHGPHRQGSMSLARTPSRKIAEDVWRDIGPSAFNMGLGSESTSEAGAGQERHVTFAEMTLEDFLAKAGVMMKDSAGHNMQSIAPFESSFENGDGIGEKLAHSSAVFGYKDVEDEKPNIKALPMLSLSAANLSPRQTGGGPEPMEMEALKHMSPLPRTLDWLTSHPFRNAPASSHQLHCNVSQHMMESNSGPKVNGTMMGLDDSNQMGPDLGMGYAAAGLLPPRIFSPLTIKAGSPTSPLSDGVGPSHGSMSSISPLSYNLDGHGVRKRGFDGSLEKVVERRQRRMIKNRESAARSRARKQVVSSMTQRVMWCVWWLRMI